LFVDSNPARRNKCERSRKHPKGYPARLACWHFGFQDLGNKCPNIIPSNMLLFCFFYGTRIGGHEQRMHRSGKGNAPRPLGGLNTSGDPGNSSKCWFEVGGLGGAFPCSPYALPMPYMRSSLI